MPSVFSDFPSVDSCLRCRGEERCSWHSDVRVSSDTRVTISGEKPVDAAPTEETNVPRVVADLPPELFYNYNPSKPSIPEYSVLPMPTKLIWEDEIRRRLSFSRNPDLKKAFDEMRLGGKLQPVKFPSIDNFRYHNFHVRYIQPDDKREWRMWRPETVPRPKECGKSLCHMEIYPYSDPCSHMM